ncbi:MAG: ABC transporter permease [Flammeovirgaceae bacterium]|nr:ABC transporter permease [Flammeovirgaceae bacterium]MDW8287930.1 ABC transporter permease [Flammeovirgaceae bacterium]
MFDLDKWQEIFATIQKNKLRTFLTALSVYWGIFMLIFMQGAGTGFENGVKRSFGNHATNACYMWGQKTKMPYQGMKPGRLVRFTNDDIAAIKREVKGIQYIAPQLRENGRILKYKEKTASFEVKGDVPEYQFINPMKVIEGRFINQIDIAQKRKIVVLGRKALEILFPNKEEYMGKYISIGGIYFQVVGVVKSFRTGEQAENDEKCAYIPLTTMQSAFNKGNRIDYFSFLAEPSYRISQLENEVKALMSQRFKIHPEDITAIGAVNLEEAFSQMNGLFAGISGLIWFVGICTIAAGVVGVSNIMLIVVKERTREIGLRKALGATPDSIVALIIQESVFITTVSGYFGLIVGVIIVEIINQALNAAADTSNILFHNPQISLNTAISATVFLIVMGALAGVIPAMKAAAVSPIEALRDE